jgi:hypothetical protein
MTTTGGFLTPAGFSIVALRGAGPPGISTNDSMGGLRAEADWAAAQGRAKAARTARVAVFI